MLKNGFFKIVAVLWFTVLSPLYAKQQDFLRTPSKEGNFSLRGSQQPGPFFSFGQNVIDAEALQVYLNPFFFKLEGEDLSQAALSIRYGVTDKVGFFATFPYNVDSVRPYHSSGYGDTSLQGEYAFDAQSDQSHTEQGTIVLGTTIPTGSVRARPALGYGTPTYFAGVTYNQVYTHALWFVSPGLLYIQPHDKLTLGKQYFYQGGIGAVFVSKAQSYIFSGLLELDGQFNERNKQKGHWIGNSGGNLIYLTPSLWYSTNKLILQIGISIPVVQSWNGVQPYVDYFTMANIAWTFN